MLPFPRILEYGNTNIPTNIAYLTSTTDALIALDDNGNMYVRGSSTNYKLGTGVNTNITDWELSLTNVRLVGGSNYFVVVVTNDNKVLYCGNTAFATGANSSSTTNVWTDITTSISSVFNISSIVEIKCLYYSAAFRLNSGAVYAKGYDNNQAFGGSASKATPVLISAGLNINNIKTSMSQSIYGSTDNKMYWRCGLSTIGQLGSSTSLTSYTSYTPVASYTTVDMGLSMVSSYMLFNTGSTTRLYLAGRNDNGIMGFGVVGSSYTSYTAATAYDNLFSSLKHDGSSNNSFMAIGVNGRVYGTGLNTSGQLGIPSITSNVNAFTMIDYNFNAPQKIIYCGTVNLVQDSEGFYYTGNNTSTGLPAVNTFTKVPNLP